MMTNKQIDGILASDGDLLVLGAPWIIKDVRGDSAQVAALQKATAPFETELQVVQDSKLPLFCDSMSVHVRSAIASVIGSDYFPGGSRDFGPKRVHDAWLKAEHDYEKICNTAKRRRNEGTTPSSDDSEPETAMSDDFRKIKIFAELVNANFDHLLIAIQGQTYQPILQDALQSPDLVIIIIIIMEKIKLFVYTQNIFFKKKIGSLCTASRWRCSSSAQSRSCFGR